MLLLAFRDTLRNNLLEFTRIAFRILPAIEKPSILDIGCGTGVQTIELAKISNGKITAIDIDKESLQILKKKVREYGLSDRVSVIELSMFELDRLCETFDIIWAEGSIFVVGFENGIRDWKQLLAANGFLVIHDQDNDVSKKLRLISKYGYRKIGQFEISHDEWWKRYYEPLEELLEHGELDVLDVNALRTEIGRFQKTGMGSIFFIIQTYS